MRAEIVIRDIRIHAAGEAMNARLLETRLNAPRRIERDPAGFERPLISQTAGDGEGTAVAGTLNKEDAARERTKVRRENLIIGNLGRQPVARDVV